MRSRADSDEQTTAAGGEPQSRRQFLRGLGACVALPAFASLAPSRLLAAGATAGAGLATTATGAPLRAAFVYFPNGAIPSAWWPKAEAPTSHSEPHAPAARAGQGPGPGPRRAGPPDGRRRAGRRRRPRPRQRHVPDRRPPEEERHRHPRRRLDRPGDRHAGRPPHPVPLARAGLRRGPQDRGVRFRLLLRLPVQPLLELADDADAAGVQPAARLRAALRRRRARRAAGEPEAPPGRSSGRSSTSSSTTPAALQRRLDSDDQAKLDQYLTGVREIETRIEKAERFGEAPDPDVDTPAGIPADYAEYVQLMYDMLVLAFQTDSTRVATLLLAHDGSNRSFDHIGISEGHHDLTHHQNRPRLDREGRRHRPLVRPAVRQVPGEARGDEGRRRQLAAAQLDDRLRQRQRRRQPPHARQPAGPPGRRRRRHAHARAATSSTAPSR